jgi:hypothetical protein
MTPLTLWAMGSDAPVKILAIAGAVALGAFVVGWLVQLAAGAFGQKVPPFVLGLVRAVAGVGCGVLVYFWLFVGGGGFGGGGWGFGRGTGKGPSEGTEKVAPKGDSTGKAGTGVGPGRAGDPLEVEVLGDELLKQLAKRRGDPSANLYRRYRVARDGKKELMTLDDVKELIKQRRERPGLPEVSIVVYKDSPAADTAWVTDLMSYAEGLAKPGAPLKVSRLNPGHNAPTD